MDPADQRYGPERTCTLYAFAEMSLVQSVMNKLNIYLDELQSDLYLSTGIMVSLSTICCTFWVGIHKEDIAASCTETIRD